MTKNAETKAETAARIFFNATEGVEFFATNAEKRAYLFGTLNALFVGGFYNIDEYGFQWNLVNESYPLNEEA